MNVLLDTHAFLWFVLNDPQLSATARTHIEDPANTKHISPASYWEIAIKMSIGKYTLTVPHEVFFETAITDNGFTILHIESRQALQPQIMPKSATHVPALPGTHVPAPFTQRAS